MAPNKIEDHIREKMQEREIKPSPDAWAKLEARLGKEEKKEGFGRNAWFAIAASFIGILILASVFLNSGNDAANSIDIVTEEVNSEEMNSEIIKMIPEQESPTEELEEAVAVETTNSEVNKSSVQKVEETSTFIAKSNEQKEANVNNEQIVIPEVKTEDKLIAKVDEKTVEMEEQPINDKDFVERKVDEVVAEVENIMKTNSTVSPEEIDALLIQAQREISKRRILNSETNKVNATALLEDVEFELERSFRDKVFDALGEGFQKIRTAVAERNN